EVGGRAALRLDREHQRGGQQQRGDEADAAADEREREVAHRHHHDHSDEDAGRAGEDEVLEGLQLLPTAGAGGLLGAAHALLRSVVVVVVRAGRAESAATAWKTPTMTA